MKPLDHRLLDEGAGRLGVRYGTGEFARVKTYHLSLYVDTRASMAVDCLTLYWAIHCLTLY